MTATAIPWPDPPALSDLASFLFVCPTPEADNLGAEEIRRLVIRRYNACDGDCSGCRGEVAQEAGDHPDRFLLRMNWALAAVREAFADWPVRR